MPKTLDAEPWRSLPKRVADLIEPELPAVTEEILETIARDVPEYARPLEGRFGRGIRTGVNEALRQFVALIRDPDAGRDRGRDVYVQLGRGEQRVGRTLDSLQAAYRIGARVAWRRIAEAGQRAKLEPEPLTLLADAIFAYIDELSADSVEGYAAARSETDEVRARRRHELVELLMRSPPVDSEDIRAAAHAAAWKVPRSLAALACAEDDLVSVVRRLPADALATGFEGVGCVLIPDPIGPGRPKEIERATTERRAALGPPCSPIATRESWALARATLQATATGALQADALARAEDHLADLLLFEGAAIARRIAARHLHPFESLTPRARERMEETALAYLDHRGNAVEMAGALHLHPQTVRYRVARLKDLLGDRLEDPDARFELEIALRAQRRRFFGSVPKTTSQSGEETPNP